ncbi:uncharacterized protein LOC141535241 [Cotesia typhae]|uniref:uncharacterized protein LOC141535241 n=1 Tax=Cotesia typhae TaxID=2053667 RepID=UPI003D694723
MHFILLLQLLVAMTSAAVINDIEGLYFSHSPQPNEYTDSQNGYDINGLFTYNSDKSANMQNFAYANAFGNVSGAINIEQIRRKNLEAFIEQIQNFNITGFDAVKFYNDVMDFYHRYDRFPIHIQVKPIFDQNFIDVGRLYRQNGIPRDEMPRPQDIDNLYQYNGNYPVYPQH